jgi:small subunit ribosomal protein S8
MNTDPIADFLTRIRNAARIGNVSVVAPYSSVKEGIAKILEEENFVEKVRVDRSEKFPVIVVTLQQGVSSLQLKRVSKPGRRVYKASKDLRPTRGGLGISILTTNKGLMTGDNARKEKLGGEVICEVY